MRKSTSLSMSSMIFIVYVWAFVMTTVSTETIKGRIDMAVIFNREYPTSNEKWSTKIREEFKKFVDNFEVNESNVHLALVYGGEETTKSTRVLHDFVPRKDAFDNLEKFPVFANASTKSDMAAAFKATRRDLFKRSRPGSAKVVVAFLSAPTIDRTAAIKESARLRRGQNGTRVYVITVASSKVKDLSTLYEDAVEYVGDKENRVFSYDIYDGPDVLENVFSTAKKQILFDLCNFESACVYTKKDRSKCEHASWQSETPEYFLLGYREDQCNNETEIDRECNGNDMSECEKDCDERWPWKSACGCGEIQRRTSEPPEKMAHCARTLECPEQCPAPADESLSAGVLAAIVLGAVVGALIILVLIMWVCLFLKNSPVSKMRKKRAAKRKGGGKMKKAGSKKKATKGSTISAPSTTANEYIELDRLSLVASKKAPAYVELASIQSKKTESLSPMYIEIGAPTERVPAAKKSASNEYVMIEEMSNRSGGKNTGAVSRVEAKTAVTRSRDSVATSEYVVGMTKMRPSKDASAAASINMTML